MKTKESKRTQKIISGALVLASLLSSGTIPTSFAGKNEDDAAPPLVQNPLNFHPVISKNTAIDTDATPDNELRLKKERELEFLEWLKNNFASIKPEQNSLFAKELLLREERELRASEGFSELFKKFKEIEEAKEYLKELEEKLNGCPLFNEWLEELEKTKTVIHGAIEDRERAEEYLKTTRETIDGIRRIIEAFGSTMAEGNKNGKKKKRSGNNQKDSLQYLPIDFGGPGMTKNLLRILEQATDIEPYRYFFGRNTDKDSLKVLEIVTKNNKDFIDQFNENSTLRLTEAEGIAVLKEKVFKDCVLPSVVNSLKKLRETEKLLTEQLEGEGIKSKDDLDQKRQDLEEKIKEQKNKIGMLESELKKLEALPVAQPTSEEGAEAKVLPMEGEEEQPAMLPQQQPVDETNAPKDTSIELPENVIESDKAGVLSREERPAMLPQQQPVEHANKTPKVDSVELPENVIKSGKAGVLPSSEERPAMLPQQQPAEDADEAKLALKSLVEFVEKLYEREMMLPKKKKEKQPAELPEKQPAEYTNDAPKEDSVEPSKSVIKNDKAEISEKLRGQLREIEGDIKCIEEIIRRAERYLKETKITIDQLSELKSRFSAPAKGNNFSVLNGDESTRALIGKALDTTPYEDLWRRYEDRQHLKVIKEGVKKSLKDLNSPSGCDIPLENIEEFAVIKGNDLSGLIKKVNEELTGLREDQRVIKRQLDECEKAGSKKEIENLKRTIEKHNKNRDNQPKQETIPEEPIENVFIGDGKIMEIHEYYKELLGRDERNRKEQKKLQHFTKVGEICLKEIITIQTELEALVKEWNNVIPAKGKKKKGKSPSNPLIKKNPIWEVKLKEIAKRVFDPSRFNRSTEEVSKKTEVTAEITEDYKKYLDEGIKKFKNTREVSQALRLLQITVKKEIETFTVVLDKYRNLSPELDETQKEIEHQISKIKKLIR